MIIDAENELGAAQAITTTAASTNYLDRGAAGDLGVSEGLIAVFTVTEAFEASGAATLQAALQKDDNSSFTSPVIVLETTTIGKATLVTGYQFHLPIPPGTDERYLRANYTVATGPFTAGKLSCQIVKGLQKNVSLPDGLAAQATV
jgi:hypothetical protein